jgi:hypothetical protein
MGIPEGKRPLGRARHSWTDNIIVDLEEIEWEGFIRLRIWTSLRLL